jgi:hypothetical protein
MHLHDRRTLDPFGEQYIGLSRVRTDLLRIHASASAGSMLRQRGISAVRSMRA